MEELSQAKYTVKVYEEDEQLKYINEVDKITLLNQLVRDQGFKSGLVIQMVEHFSCELGMSKGYKVFCIVFEHLELSL